MSLKGKLHCVGLTDTGRVREHNEDMIAVDGELGLVVLADGMGGYNAGEVAAALRSRHLQSGARGHRAAGPVRARQNHRTLTPQHHPARRHPARQQDHLPQTARSQANCEGMGTTVVAALFHDNRVSVAHVGDSRMYRLRGAEIEQVTLDHSLLQELVDRGFYSPKRRSGPPTRTM